MRQSFTPSGWIWTGKSAGRKAKKRNSGILPGKRQMMQREGKCLSPISCFLIDFFLLLMGTEGVVTGFFSAFSYPCYEWALYVETGVLTFALVLFFSINIPRKYKQYVYGAGIGIVVLFAATNGSFVKQGFLDCVQGMKASFYLRYETQDMAGEFLLGKGALTLFFALVICVVVLILAFATIGKVDLLPIFLIEFPVLMVILLMGRKVNNISLSLLLLHFVGCIAQEYALRGNHIANGAEGDKNRRCLESVQKKAACVAALGVLFASCISLYVFMPLLPAKIPAFQKWGAHLQNRVVAVAVEYLPVISAGKWKLQVQTAGGGASDGALGDVAGYALTNLDDLLVTSTIEPKETLYLKGYIGSIYEGDKWAELPEEQFDYAAIYWHTEDKPRTYIQNLPFLRQIYRETREGVETGMGVLSIENINAGGQYTFVPYCAYLNDYYEISQGDGSIRSQSVAADEISYFPLQLYIETMQARPEEEEEEILDRAESEYGAYVKQNYLAVPEGFGQLQEECLAQDIGEDDIEGIIRYVETFLVRNCRYRLEVPRLPEGKDFVQYFLYESKEGYSAHFASAATLMFRMFGVPARYVTGYAVPESLFSMDAEGNYTALLQSDNAHAWAEIYLEGIGWVPVECTPGNIGVLRNIELSKEEEEALQQEEEQAEEQAEESLLEEEDEEEAPEEQPIYAKVRLYLGGFAIFSAIVILAILLWRKVLKGLDRHGYGRGQSANDRLLSLFCLVHETLQKAGMPGEVRSTSPEFSRWLRKVLPDMTKKQAREIVGMALASAYGKKKTREEDVQFMRDIYRQCRKAVRHGKFPG
ncbi:MAG: transglutaminase-like domain-containing protein [Muribaculaceae bacterium]|nr:transglutaminase-like domain-containing protein [Muribaculaceae bacterium]